MTRNLWLSLFAIIVSVAVHYALGPWTAKWIADSLVLGVAAGMAWTWGRAALAALREGARSGADKIVVTLWLAWLMYFVQRVYVFANKDGAFSDTLAPQIIATFIFLAGMYGLAAPVEPGGREPLPTAVISGWFVTGLVAGGTAVYLLLTSGI